MSNDNNTIPMTLRRTSAWGKNKKPWRLDTPWGSYEARKKRTLLRIARTCQRIGGDY